MFRKILLGIATGLFAFGILSVSVFKSASVRYVFSETSTPASQASDSAKVNIEYNFPYPGRILPDNPLWPLKALRDKIWLALTTNRGKKAELNLLFADKRLSSAKILFERQKSELAFSTLTKAEKYLEEASFKEEESRNAGADTSEFLFKLAIASLKHREEIGKMLEIAPEDAKPNMIQVENYSRNVYKTSRDALNSLGKTSPKSPFDED